MQTQLAVLLVLAVTLQCGAYARITTRQYTSINQRTLTGLQTPFVPSKTELELHPAAAIVASADANAVIVQVALKSIANLLSTCGVGFVFAKKGLLDQNSLSTLSKLIFSVFQPMFLFGNVFSVVSNIFASGETNAAIFMLPLAAIVQLGLGLMTGKLFTLLLYGREDSSEQAKELMACCTFSNSGPLPMVFASGIFRSNAAVSQKAIAYISLYLLGWSPFFWILGPAVLGDNVPTQANISPEEKAKVTAEKRKALLARIFSPPVMASLCGMGAASVPFLRHLVRGPFNPLLETSKTLGNAYLPAVLLVLAGSLANTSGGSSAAAETPQQSMFKSMLEKAKNNAGYAKQLLAIYLAKFLFIPTFTFALIAYARKTFPVFNTFLVNDPMLYFVLLIETCMPSAQNLTVILQLQGKKDASARLARTLLFIYVLGVPSICYWLIRILGLVPALL